MTPLQKNHFYLRPEAERVVVVTGAAGGIGAAVVEAFLAARWCVAATDLSEMALKRLSKNLSRGASSALGLFPMDVTSRSKVERASQKIVKFFGRVDALVNCAGIFEQTPLKTLAEDRMIRLTEINLHGTLRCMSVFGGIMARQKHGRIVNVASVAGEGGSALASVYAATKAGIIAATQSAAREWGSDGISVNAIAPGFCDTPMLGQNRGIVERLMLPKIPLRRLAQAEEIAELALFLASCRTDYITGSTIRIDGGLRVG